MTDYYNTKQMQDRLSEVFKFVIEFFDKHNLKYILCGGTLLGAVRHKGFIPWDDDIDIYLYREDYQKLFTLKQEIQKLGYSLQSLNDEGYYLSFAKITDNNSTIWEKDKFPFLLGVFIDVFPLDRFSCEDNQIIKYQRKARRLFRRYQTAVSKITVKILWKYFYSFRWVTLFIGLQKGFDKRVSERYKKAFLDFEAACTDNKGLKCASLTTAKGRIFKCEWFDKTIDGIFENIPVRIPSGYDEYLTSLYGDYMQLPPEEKRHTVHSTKYVSLTQRYSMQEIQAQLKNVGV